MKYSTGSFSDPGAQASRHSYEQKILGIAVIMEAVFCLGLTISSDALGSHLTFPGSNDLHHPQNSTHQPLIRQLEAINKYTSSHPLPNRDDEGAPMIESSPLTSTSPRSDMTKTPPSSPSRLSHSATHRDLVPSAVIKDINTAQGHMEMGWMFLLNGKLKAAMAAYREALRHDPLSDKAFIGMGMTLKRMGKIKDAKQAIQQALKLNPFLSSALVHLGYLHADGDAGHSDSETARRLFTQALQLGDPFAGIALLDLQLRANSK